MIGRIRGEILAKQPPRLLVEVAGGIGYELETPLSVFYDLPEVGAQVTLLTHLLVREDAQILYGFLHERERLLFRHLLRVSGIGARLALAILSGMDAREFAACVQRADLTALSRLPGIGRKTAQRLVIELTDRLGDLGLLTDPGGPAGAPDGASLGVGGASGVVSDAIGALIALGYKPTDAQRMARAAVEAGASDLEAILRAALKAANPA